ncbi:MAG: hypothetical protein AAF585_07325 [Verrucomicrobiota bacterium]
MAIWLGVETSLYLRQDAAIQRMKSEGATVYTEPGWLAGQLTEVMQDWMERKHGGEWSRPFVKVTVVRFEEGATDDDLRELRRVRAIESLYLDESIITDAGLMEIGRRHELQTLDLDWIQGEITPQGLEQLRGLSALKELRLSGLQITDEHLAALPACFPNLTVLTLGGRITDEGLANLSGLTRLEELHISGTDVDGTGFAHLGTLPNLSKLQIASNRLTDEGMVHLGRLPAIRWLKIWDEEGITEKGLASLSGSPMLEQLLLIWLPATEGDLSALSGCAKLRYLDINNKNLSDESLVSVGRISTLSTLRIGGKNLTDEGLMHLDGLPSLRRLHLFSTSVTPSGVAELQAKLPSAQIERH